MTPTPPPQAPYKQLRRPTTDRMIAGVASGLGRYFAVDPTLVRVVFAVAALATGGIAALAYPIMWFLMPEEPPGAPAWPHPTNTSPPAPPVSWPPAGPPMAAPRPTPAPAPQDPTTPVQAIPADRPAPEPPTVPIATRPTTPDPDPEPQTETIEPATEVIPTSRPAP
ncbi:PspC domain-containing protein [Micromonospora sp. KC213]|nr:PspC domain-containing protein [Micromonospora sp. KC213]